MKPIERRSLACTTCAKAKARCIPGPVADGDCERCHRLSKTCLSRAPAPPRPKKQLKRSRVAELEKRLSELEGCGGQKTISRTLPAASPLSSSLSGSRQEQAPSRSQPQQQPSPSSTTPTASNAPTEEDKSSTLVADSPKRRKSSFVGPGLLLDHLFLSKESSSWPNKECVASSMKQKPWESLWPQPGEAEVILETYRNVAAGLFPFVVVPETIRANEMKAERPFLWKAIMMVGCFLDGERHERLGEDLLAEISRATMVDGVSSLDVLQGLQLLLAWYHCSLKSSRLTNLLFLARSLCLSLGMSGNQTAAENASSRNLDTLRAYAGTYYINTLVFTTNKRSEVLMNTGYLEKCCSILESAKQHESDEFLVALVRVQQLAQSISLTLSMDPGHQPMQLPMTMVVQSFQEQISSLRSSLSPEVASNSMMVSHINIAEMLLTEWVISDRQCHASNMTLTDRLRLLWSCVSSVCSFFLTRTGTWEEFDNPRFLCLHGSDVSYALITGIRLVTLRLPGWDLEHIERELNFRDIMDKVIIHLTGLADRRRRGSLSSALGSDGTGDPLSGLARLCIGMRELIKVEMARAVEESKEGGSNPPPAFDPMQILGDGGGDFGDLYWREFVNDAFWMGSVDVGDFEFS